MSDGKEAENCGRLTIRNKILRKYEWYLLAHSEAAVDIMTCWENIKFPSEMYIFTYMWIWEMVIQNNWMLSRPSSLVGRRQVPADTCKVASSLMGKCRLKYELPKFWCPQYDLLPEKVTDRIASHQWLQGDKMLWCIRSGPQKKGVF